jgi:hypothetical protein
LLSFQTRYLGAVRLIFDRFKKHFDIILVDTGPSIDIINQVVISGSDYILPPCFPDLFSTGAMWGLLQKVLPEWQTTLHLMCDKQAEAYENKPRKPAYLLKNKFPDLLPFIVTNYAFETMSDGGNKQITVVQTEFLYTMKEYVRRAAFGANDKEARCGHYVPYIQSSTMKKMMVLPLLESTKWMPKTYSMGRTFGEMTEERYIDTVLHFSDTDTEDVRAEYEADIRDRLRREGFMEFVEKVAAKYNGLADFVLFACLTNSQDVETGGSGGPSGPSGGSSRGAGGSGAAGGSSRGGDGKRRALPNASSSSTD